MKKIYVYTDGGSRNNPGQAAIGFVVIDESNDLVYQSSKAIGIATNNVAEYRGLIEAVQWLKDNKNKLDLVSKVVFRSDSELVVKQLTGKYRIKDNKLKPLAAEAVSLLKQLGTIYSFELIPREKNKLADKLVNNALDQSI